MASPPRSASLTIRAFTAAAVVSAGWVVSMQVTRYHPFVSDMMFALPAVVVIAAGRGVPAVRRAAWMAAALGAMALIHALGVALSLRVWPTTPVGVARLYAGIAYESLSWSVSPLVAMLFVRRFPAAFAAARSRQLRRRA